MNAQDARPTSSGTLWTIKLGTVVALVIGLGLWPRPAYADWRSLTGTLPEHVDRLDYVISPDSRIVAFTADINTDDVTELYAVPITETTPITLTPLNPPLVTDGNVNNSGITFTPDSQSLIYLADQEVVNRTEMYSVPVGGGLVQKLNPPLAVGGNVAQFRIDDKNKRIVYLADQETNEVFELWSIPLGGGTAENLSGPLVSGGKVGIFTLDPLSNRVVFSADAETDGKYELYSVPIAGGTRLKLNPPIELQGGGDSGIFSAFAVNPQLPVVVFIAREAAAPGGRLYSVFTAGGVPPNQLSFEMLATQRILSFRISPVGDRVIFNVGTKVGNTNAFKGNLYSNLIGGDPTTVVPVTETADPLFGADISGYRFLPNGSLPANVRIVYSFQNNAAAPVRLEAATVLGVRTPLYVPGPSDDPLSGFDFSPNNEWVMYQTSDGGTEQRIHTIPPTGGNATNFGLGRYQLITPDSARITYTRIVTIENRTELFSAQIFGGDERNLSGLNGTGYAFDVRASPDSKWIVFQTQINSQYDLRVSDGTEAQPPIPPITGLTVTNDGPKVVSDPISFTTSISGGTEISYTWDFGDGSAGSGITTTHPYTQAGVYTATVLATNATNSLSATTTVYVGDAVVAVTDNQYTPQHVTVAPGGTVIWVLKGGTHSVTAADGSFNQPAGSDWPPFVHVFVSAAATAATPISYHCTVHGALMFGTVTVTDEQDQDRLLLPSLRRER
jgi:PKD repeat protein